MKKLVWLIGGIVSVSSFSTVACSDDDDDDTNGSGGTAGTGTSGKGGSSGKGGAAGSSGKGGAAGSSGKGGTGGNAGTAGSGTGGKGGTAGTGGSDTSGGEAGMSGDTGTGGAAAGEAGTGGVSGSGAAGEAGMGGAGGEAPVPLTCAEIPSQAMGDAGFTVTVAGVTSCGPIPADHTCEAKPFAGGTSPAITWTAGPTGTLSYALVFKDISILSNLEPTDPLYNRGYHYVMWDIPSTVTALPAAMAAGHLSTEVPGARQWAPFNDYAFFGPCPNFDPALGTDIEDSYAFTLYALPTATAAIAAPTTGISTPRQLDDQFKAAALAVAEYRGTSDAHASVAPPGPPTGTPPCPTDGTPLDGCQAGPP